MPADPYRTLDRIVVLLEEIAGRRPMTPATRRWVLASAIGSVVLGVLLLTASRTYAAASITIQCADPSGPTTTLCEVYQDPDVHHGSLGTVLFSAPKATKATIALPTGEHKIAIRASATTSLGTNTSVLVYGLGTTCPQPGWRSLGYQAWWSDPGQDPTFESRHEHVDGLCWPVNNLVVDGPQTFTFNVQLHNQPAGAKFSRIRVDDFCSGSGCSLGGKGSGYRLFERTTGLPQPDANGNLAPTPVAFSVDLSRVKAGRHEFRIGLYTTQPNGKVQLLSTRAELCIRSCSPSYRSLSSFPVLQGNGGWYTSADYIDARILSVLP